MGLQSVRLPEENVTLFLMQVFRKVLYVDDVVSVKSDGVTINNRLDILNIRHFGVSVSALKLGENFKVVFRGVGDRCSDVVFANALRMQVSVVECQDVRITGYCRERLV
jgi:hypothetical protein